MKVKLIELICVLTAMLLLTGCEKEDDQWELKSQKLPIKYELVLEAPIQVLRDDGSLLQPQDIRANSRDSHPSYVYFATTAQLTIENSSTGVVRTQQLNVLDRDFISYNGELGHHIELVMQEADERVTKVEFDEVKFRMDLGDSKEYEAVLSYGQVAWELSYGFATSLLDFGVGVRDERFTADGHRILRKKLRLSMIRLE